MSPHIDAAVRHDAALLVERLSAARGDFCIRDVTLECRPGEYHVVLGPTGCGKTTLLKTILGLYPARAGTIRLGGRDMTTLPPEHRRMGYLPQHQTLFPHLDVTGNIAFGLDKNRGVEAERIVRELCTRLGIGHLRGRAVAGLSGGERQKVALARALAIRPAALLLDEPFSALDEGGRRELWFDFKKIVDEVDVPVLHVTHNLDEAYTLGARVTMLIAGCVAQSGPPREILERPASEAVARYLGYRNIFRGRAAPHPGGCRIDCGHFSVVGPAPATNAAVSVCIRPQDIKIIRAGDPVREELLPNIFAGELTSLFILPDVCVARIRVGQSDAEYDLEMRIPAPLATRFGLAAGKRIQLGIWTPGIIVFPTGENPDGPAS